MIWKRKPPKNKMPPFPSDAPQTLPERQDFEAFAGLTPSQEAEPPREGRRAQVLPFEKPEEEEESAEDSPHAYGRYRTPGGGYGVKIFLPDGAVHALPYTQITTLATSPNADTLTLQCNFGALFIITGRHLAPLRTALLRHRAAFLKAPAQGPGETAIQSISIDYPSSGR